MTSKVINIALSDDNKEVILTNEKEYKVVIDLKQKQIATKKIYDLLDYSEVAEYILSGDEKFAVEELSGPNAEHKRLYNYVYEYMIGLFQEITDAFTEE